MKARVVHVLAGAGLLAVTAAAPAIAQTPGPSCLFPLACPGAVPPKPEPLLGPPVDPATAPVEPASTTKHHTRKRRAANKGT